MYQRRLNVFGITAGTQVSRWSFGYLSNVCMTFFFFHFFFPRFLDSNFLPIRCCIHFHMFVCSNYPSSFSIGYWIAVGFFNSRKKKNTLEARMLARPSLISTSTEERKGNMRVNGTSSEESDPSKVSQNCLILFSEISPA